LMRECWQKIGDHQLVRHFQTGSMKTGRVPGEEKKKFLKVMKELFLYSMYMVALAFFLYYVFTYIHELGHQKEMASEGVASTSLVWPDGQTFPSSFEDCEKFNALAQESKAKIYYGGIKYDMMALRITVLFLVLTILYGVYNPQGARKGWYCLLLLGIALAIGVLVYFIAQNSNPLVADSDMWKVVKNHTFDCSIVTFSPA